MLLFNGWKNPTDKIYQYMCYQQWIINKCEHIKQVNLHLLVCFFLPFCWVCPTVLLFVFVSLYYVTLFLQTVFLPVCLYTIWLLGLLTVHLFWSVCVRHFLPLSKLMVLFVCTLSLMHLLFPFLPVKTCRVGGLPAGVQFMRAHPCWAN